MKKYTELSFVTHLYVNAKNVIAYLNAIDVKTFDIKLDNTSDVNFIIDLEKLNQEQIKEIKNYICRNEIDKILFS